MRPKGPRRKPPEAGLPRDNAPDLLDHQQLAYDLIGQWEVGSRREFWKTLDGLNRWDLALVVERIANTARYLGWKAIQYEIEGKADEAYEEKGDP